MYALLAALEPQSCGQHGFDSLVDGAEEAPCIHIARLSSFWFSTGSVSSADATGFSFSKLLSGDTAKTMPSVLRFALVKGTMTRAPGTILSSKCSGML